jgi:cell division protein FtsB
MSDDVRQPHGSASCACLFCWHDIATLTAELAAERAEVERLRAEHTFVERLVAGQLLSRMTELEADLAAERAEIERLRAAGDSLAEAVGDDADDPWILATFEAWREARR